MSPKSKSLHILSSIDKETLTATCTVCGPTEVRQYTKDNKYTTYFCIKGNRQRSAAYRLAHPRISRLQQRSSTSHILSNIDDEARTATCSICGPVRIYIRRGKITNTRVCKNAANQRAKKAEKRRQKENHEFIESYKLSQGCKDCGARDSAAKLQFHAPGKSRREDHINKLLRFKHERLVLELQKYDVLCKNCHDRAHFKPPRITNRRRIKRNPPPFMYDA